ncbi:uncharacterized protein PpBr36_06453 [Pyricularia pennisetigena]|uniref:uncharacterized protein n=1 Tax=Pyricularia pennisetigena TaxID=1578925 RepID=UPI0011530E19|nr:uncharacterized protein PpBr36_06453 [Pyricularia pennisetigena]TLS22939.1 hypothetical protein PpBr36_06453 [Pyricularia pennisetigena]
MSSLLAFVKAIRRTEASDNGVVLAASAATRASSASRYLRSASETAPSDSVWEIRKLRRVDAARRSSQAATRLAVLAASTGQTAVREVDAWDAMFSACPPGLKSSHVHFSSPV